MILEQCKGVHCVDLGESFQTHIYLQNVASIQPRTSLLKSDEAQPDASLAVCGAGSAAAGACKLGALLRSRETKRFQISARDPYWFSVRVGKM